MSRSGISSWKVAGAYIGTIVGAGFATGQEVLQFFVFFGTSGIVAIALVTLLFMFFGYVILELGQRLRADSHREVIQYAGGRWLGTLIDGVITFFLFGALTAMAAGAGAVFSEQFGLSSYLGSLLLLGLTLAVVMVGISAVISAISYLVPLLLLSLLGIFIATLWFHPVDWAVVGQATDPRQAPVPFWPLSAINYVSYNLVLAVAVLAPMGKHVLDRSTLRQGAFWGGLGLGVGSLAIFLTVISYLPGILAYEVPMAFIAAQFTPFVQIAYSIILLLQIFTTAVGSLFGFASRLTSQESPSFRWILLGTVAGAFVAGQFGFTNLIRILYPAVGYAGLLMLAGLLLGYGRERWVLLQPAFRRKD
ncbi:YkvI family membrane protein [Heliorestis convoluta]|uniref:Putative membrane protein n=1 Tax=Heliorestis convoluta TaxID=356322 RepID=A0A5Q2MYY0_9FIRM|nr:hypothetical protein [Heliorestis convoluta]QGG46643.1 putative membrane protein [Heliorestis convoluta]